MSDKYGLGLKKISQTYKWALSLSIGDLLQYIDNFNTFPLLAVGSGGSLTAAYLAALLHQETGVLAKAVTPLELNSFRNIPRETKVLILSAGGGNPDVLSAFRHAALSDAIKVFALSLSTNSPLIQLAKKFKHAHVLSFNPPTGKDGFLALNSLIIFSTILIRAYSQFFSNLGYELSEDLLTFPEVAYEQLISESRPLLDKSTWIVLYNGWGKPAAVDAESKFIEAALKNLQVVDYRNFAHGRHFWLSRRGDATGVVALVTPDDQDIAEKTLYLLPSNVPVLRLETCRPGPVGGLDLLVRIMQLVHIVGKSQGIDPGKPGVPYFGRQLYHLNVYERRSGIESNEIGSNLEDVFILRKSKSRSLFELSSEELTLWRHSYRSYLKELRSALYSAVVFDYDGTLCDSVQRYTGIPYEISTELERLLAEGIYLGIATGRGKSVREVLQVLIPDKFWQQILIGYYNGADIAPLSNTDRPNKHLPMNPALKSFMTSLKKNALLSRVTNLECRPKQISVELTNLSSRKIARSIIQDLLMRGGFSGVKMVESTHSLDIIAPGVSKLNLTKEIENLIQNNDKVGKVLCFGDMGEWPGNDFELLSSPYSVSVDMVSSDPASCWNLNPPGVQGTYALLKHLRSMKIFGGFLRFKPGVKG